MLQKMIKMKTQTEHNKHLPCVVYYDYTLYLCKLFDFFLVGMIVKEVEYLDIHKDLEKLKRYVYVYA